MYATEVESQWLHYYNLLLNLTTRSPDYDRVLYEPLTDCEFKARNFLFTLNSANNYYQGVQRGFLVPAAQHWSTDESIVLTGIANLLSG